MSEDASQACEQSPAVMQHNLKILRKRRGWRLQDAAEAFGLSSKGYEKIESGERRLSADRISQAAQIYGVALSEIISASHEIPVVGTVSHGGTVHYASSGDINCVAPRPNDATSETVALLVDKGVSVPGIAIENYFIYHDEKRVGVPSEHLEKLCFVQIEGGDILIRRIYPGSSPDVFDLVGMGFETLRDKRVAWSALMTWLKPR
ncbi:helix-turn-helix domain-containing protein [Methylorubrum sp. Q1]|uniref:helix-turn-helix domain-containing protein n=1 Tax=Methylorubrum sp. Q1 TaxID=2562453 RepID=UPI00187D58B0|nr:helix-turn-helix transcriptional regulator [Methylorubrum sp. Q1]